MELKWSDFIQKRANWQTKKAARGDIVNAGFSSMAMGSPFTPRLYSQGTSKLRSLEQIAAEQRNSAVAGPLGLLAGYGGIGGLIGTFSAPDVLAYALGRGDENKAFDAASDVITRARIDADKNPSKPYSDIVRDSINVDGESFGHGLESFKKRIDSRPTAVDRIRNPTMRHILNKAQKWVGGGSLVDLYNNYHALREDGNSPFHSAVKSVPYSLPWFRIAHGDKMPSNTPKGSFARNPVSRPQRPVAANNRIQIYDR